MSRPLNTSRRKFIAHCSKALGGAAMIGVAPTVAHATRRPDRELYDQAMWSMGTQVRLSILRDEFAPKVLDGAFAAIRQVDQDLSVHRETSELSLLNSAAGSWRSASRGLVEVAAAALEVGDLSEGAMDVTVLPALRRIGFAPTFGPGSHKEVIDYTKLHVKGNNVRLETGGYAVDFGGVAKGYAVDEAITSLRSTGIGVALLDAGGDLYAMGRPESTRRWKIGIRDPFHPETLFATLEVEDEAVATSGTYAQTREVDGVTQSHLINPETGLSVTHVVSATVLARSAIIADALATAISVMPPNQSMALIQSMPETEAIWVYANGSTAQTDGLKNRLHIL